MVSRKEKKANRFKGLFGIIILILLFLGLGRKAFHWYLKGWDGVSQFNYAIESQTGDIFILVLNPPKNMAALITVPKNLLITTPWFGEYQAGKLSLLAKQENNANIFSRSLTYFLEIPIDSALMGVKLKDVDNFDKGDLAKVFLNAQSLGNFKIWRYLDERDLVWKNIDLENLAEVEELPDKSKVLKIDPSSMEQFFWEFLSDISIKDENLGIAVFNTSKIDGLAQKIGSIITNMGGRVIELSTKEFDQDDDCLILISKNDLLKTKTIKRLKIVFGCEVKEQTIGEIGDIQVMVKNVKI